MTPLRSGMKSLTKTRPPAQTQTLTAKDRCDRCGARAKVATRMPSGSGLAWCAHHWCEHAAAIRSAEGRVVADVRDADDR